MFKKIIRKLLCILDSMARARAAGVLARQGQVEAAKRLMTREGESKC